MKTISNLTKGALLITILAFLSISSIAQQKPQMSGNPVIQGWNADPEAKIFEGQYWIYPTYSAPYEQQVHFDAWSSKDLVHGQSIPILLTLPQ